MHVGFNSRLELVRGHFGGCLPLMASYTRQRFVFGMCPAIYMSSLTPSFLLYCIACAAGEYDSASDGNCLPCPANSDSEAGATICTCDEGYYRSGTEGPDIGCTREFTGSNSNITLS